MTHHEREDAPSSSDERLTALLGALTDDDVARLDPPADLFAAIAERAPSPGERPSDRPVVIAVDERRWSARSRWLALAAAAVVVLVVGVGISVAVRPSTPSDRVLASTQLRQLEPLGSTKVSAKLVTTGGETHLVIGASDMPPAPAGSTYELWLIDRGVTDPRSLGIVTGSEDVVVPSSIDPAKFPVVDISLEPDDGDHLHSGHSLMRGELA